ncbi:sulfite exporter TauE/SafE family protein [Acidiphilium sp. PA]|uniref:sulfite exporter TauE/SafE family protein n=1 Tax=Acidiphilium sp. PA TaxID=2871705 RepID=UPI0022443202|nr:sulfite exporter TauE/SafE family protein [Acidiphilium sp. PA]MCW8305410.1 sulfite exporter TauE/SafE family protein [Acidiphilium sp. PA]
MNWRDLVLVAVSFVAGAQNALAGGGSFLTFPALLLAGLDPRAANITSTIALFPGQVTTGIAGRNLVTGAAGLGFATLFGISLIGGALGAVLLLTTPAGVFAHMVPFLVLFATSVFAWGSFGRRPDTAMAARLGVRGAAAAQFLISIYGGYFGGGIGILMLAALTATGVAVRQAGATKNVLAGVMNAAAVVVFLARAHIAWGLVLYVAIAAVLGGQAGVFLLRRINERILRAGVVLVGLGLTIGLFIDMR